MKFHTVIATITIETSISLLLLYNLCAVGIIKIIESKIKIDVASLMSPSPNNKEFNLWYKLSWAIDRTDTGSVAQSIAANNNNSMGFSFSSSSSLKVILSQINNEQDIKIIETTMPTNQKGKIYWILCNNNFLF